MGELALEALSPLAIAKKQIGDGPQGHEKGGRAHQDTELILGVLESQISKRFDQSTAKESLVGGLSPPL